jgi:hypothetical protein
VALPFVQISVVCGHGLPSKSSSESSDMPWLSTSTGSSPDGWLARNR